MFEKFELKFEQDEFEKNTLVLKNNINSQFIRIERAYLLPILITVLSKVAEFVYSKSNTLFKNVGKSVNKFRKVIFFVVEFLLVKRSSLKYHKIYMFEKFEFKIEYFEY